MNERHDNPSLVSAASPRTGHEQGNVNFVLRVHIVLSDALVLVLIALHIVFSGTHFFLVAVSFPRSCGDRSALAACKDSPKREYLAL